MNLKELEFSASDFTAAPTGNASKMAIWVGTKLRRKVIKLPLIYGNGNGEWSSQQKPGYEITGHVLIEQKDESLKYNESRENFEDLPMDAVEYRPREER